MNEKVLEDFSDIRRIEELEEEIKSLHEINVLLSKQRDEFGDIAVKAFNMMIGIFNKDKE